MCKPTEQQSVNCNFTCQNSSDTTFEKLVYLEQSIHQNIIFADTKAGILAAFNGVIIGFIVHSLRPDIVMLISQPYNPPSPLWHQPREAISTLALVTVSAIFGCALLSALAVVWPRGGSELGQAWPDRIWRESRKTDVDNNSSQTGTGIAESTHGEACTNVMDFNAIATVELNKFQAAFEKASGAEFAKNKIHQGLSEVIYDRSKINSYKYLWVRRAIRLSAIGVVIYMFWFVAFHLLTRL